MKRKNINEMDLRGRNLREMKSSAANHNEMNLSERGLEGMKLQRTGSHSRRNAKAFAAAVVLALTASSVMTAWAEEEICVTTSGKAGTVMTQYSATAANAHAIAAEGEDANYEGIIVTKTGSGSGEDADFYGTNAAVFASDGATLTITDAKISTNGNYANAVFSYGEGTTVEISDAVITTQQRNSGGIMVTGGGTLYAEDLTIRTEGGSSAAIRSDRGGGTMVVDGGSYTAGGSGSPAIYSTADITVSNAKLTSGTAQAVVVEGGNKVTLNDCEVTGKNTVQNSDKSDYYQAVMLYQSMSGDASDGDGAFTMTGGSLSSKNGEIFFVTNATYTINLEDVELSYANDDLLRACAAGWGSTGSNGGKVILNAKNQELEGNIIVDTSSLVNMYLTEGSTFKGAFENEGEVYVELEEGCVWKLTKDCSISALTCGEDSVKLCGHTLKVDGETYEEGTAHTGEPVEPGSSEGSGGNKPGEGGKGSDTPPEKPGESGESSDTPPEKPGESGEGSDTPPEKPGESGESGEDSNTPPEKPEDDSSTPPEKPEDDSSTPPAKPGAGNTPSAKPGAGNTPPAKPGAGNTPSAKPGAGNTRSTKSGAAGTLSTKISEA